LKQSAAAFGGLVFGIPSSRVVTEAANGDLTWEVPLEFKGPSPADGSPMLFHSINFDLARADLSIFTFSLPVFWAVVLAAPCTGRTRRTLLRGTLVMALAEIVLLLIFVEIFAHKTAAKLAQSQDPTTAWVLHLGEYLIVGVIPFMAPFIVAIWMHPGLR